MKFSASIEEFAAQRRGVVDEAAELLRPVVRSALGDYLNGDADWAETIIRAAQTIFEMTLEDEGGSGDFGPFRATLEESLEQTRRPEITVQDAQVERISLWLAGATVNAATMALADAEEGQFVLLEWVTMGDEDVRDLHTPLQGVQRPVGETFDVGGFDLHYPGEPVGPPEVWINCRCVVRPVLGEEMAAKTAFATAPEVEEEDVDLPDDAAPGPIPVYGVLAPMDTISGDRRKLTGDITWVDTPFPIRWVKQDFGMHDGAERTTTVDEVFVEGNEIRFNGHMMSTPMAQEHLTVLAEGRMGLSIDLDSAVFELQDENGNQFDFDMYEPGDPEPVQVVTSGRIRAATAVDISAFVEAWMGLGTWGDGAEEQGMRPAPEGALVASAFTLVDVETQTLPSAWFQDPALPGPTPVTVTQEGRVFGHVALWETCHIGYGLSVKQGSDCVAPPNSASNYAYFLTGVVDTDEGEVPTGVLTMGTGHAPERLRSTPAAAHYDNTGMAVADVNVGEDEYGIWFSGAMRSGLTAEDVRAFKASSLSGDWRTIKRKYEMVAALVVNVPGFPIPRRSMAASGGRQTTLVAAGVIHREAPDFPNPVVDMDALVAEVERRMQRKDRITKAQAAVRQFRLARAREKIGL